jgi:hypothetical protein
MITMQIEIDFTHPHNNRESELMFDENIEHFENQCKKVLRALKRGEKLTTTIALLKYGIGDLRRRIKDLKDTYHVDVKADFINGTRFKEYYL